MNAVNDQYVIFPRLLELDRLNIKYQDAIVYCALRSFNNSQTDQCYPSYETIAKRAGTSRNFVIRSIKRLKKADLISVIKSKKSGEGSKYKFMNYYKFKRMEAFERIPYELFDADLTYSQKALLISIRQFFNHGNLTSLNTVSEMAKLLGLTYQTVKKQFSSLIRKGYISERTKLTGTKAYFRYEFTNQVNWNFDYTNNKKNTDSTNYKLKIA